MAFLKRKSFSYVGLPLVVVFLCIVMQSLRPDFLSSSNLENIMRQGGPLVLVAAGQALVIIAGGLDISVGSVMGLASVIAAMAGGRWGIETGILCGVGVGTACGAFNGLMVSWFCVISVGRKGTSCGPTCPPTR